MGLNKLNHNYIEPLEVSSLLVDNLYPNNLTFAGSSNLRAGEIAVTTTATKLVDSFSASEYTTVEYVLQITQNGRVTSSKILLVTNGTSVDHTQYGIIKVGEEIFPTITSTISSGIVSLSISILKADIWSARVKFFKVSVTD